MKRWRRALVSLAVIASSCAAISLGGRDEANAQMRPPVKKPPVRTPPPAVAPVDAGNAFRVHFGIELATALARSADADERLRGLERAADLGGPEARLLLMQALSKPSDVRGTDAGLAGIARRDGRAFVAATRGLARELWVESKAGTAIVAPEKAVDGGRSDAPRTLGLVNALVPIVDEASIPARDGMMVPELQELARGIAARALAESSDPRAIEALVKSARDEAAGRPGALAAIAALRARVARVGAVDLLLPPLLSAQTVRLAGEAGDLRAIEPITQSIRASDARVRAAAIAALGELGAPNVVEPARALLRDPDPQVRVAAASALTRVGSSDAPAVIAALLADETTKERAAELAEMIESPDIDRVLFERARRRDDVAVRRPYIVALSKHHADTAATALASLVSDAAMRADVVGALARSPARGATAALRALARDPATKRLGVRALAMRALARGTDRDVALEAARPLATTGDRADRALYMFVNVALGVFSAETGLRERDADARALSVMGALAHLDAKTCRALADAELTEKDPTVRTLLASAYACEGGAEGSSTGALWTRARDGGPDAPLASFVLASRGGTSEILEWLGAANAVVRAHVARGLSQSTREDAAGRLARALAYESEPEVRRVLVRAIAPRAPGAPSAREALEQVASWDPDDEARSLAAAALRGESLPTAPPAREAAWLHVATRDGSEAGATLAAVVRADGVALPIVFDADGFAVVPGLPRGVVHLSLAPRLPRLQSP